MDKRVGLALEAGDHRHLTSPDAGPTLLIPLTSDWCLDLAGQQLVGADRECPLSPRLFQLLCAFIRRPGTVLAREWLLELVWGADYPGTLRVVDQAVCELRRLLGDDAAQPQLIRTRRGAGYLFCPRVPFQTKSIGAASCGPS